MGDGPFDRMPGVTFDVFPAATTGLFDKVLVGDDRIGSSLEHSTDPSPFFGRWTAVRMALVEARGFLAGMRTLFFGYLRDPPFPTVRVSQNVDPDSIALEVSESCEAAEVFTGS